MYDEGYDVEVIQDISSDLYCVICLKLMRNPVQFKCGHGMCFNCYKHLLHQAKNRSIKDIQCPQCREIVRESQIFSNVMLHRLILSLQVYCCSENEGCRWIGEVSQLDEHLVSCMQIRRNPRNGHELQTNSLRRKVSLPALHQDTAQNNMMFNMMDSLSSLRSKIDSIEDNLTPPPPRQRFPKKNTACSTCHTRTSSITDARKRSNERASESFQDSLKRYVSDFVEKNQVVYLKVGFFVALVSIYLMTAKLFYSLDNTQPVYASGCGTQPMESSVMQRLEKSAKSNENVYRNLVDLLAFNVRAHLHDLQSDEIRTANLVPEFYKEQNRTIVELDKRFQWMITNARQEMWTNISLFDERSIRELSLDSVSLLVDMVNPIFNSLWRRVFEEINFSEFAVVRLAGQVYEKTRQGYLEIRDKAEYHANEMKKGIGIEHKQVEYSELLSNVTQRLRKLERGQIESLISKDYSHFRSYFERGLKGFYENITQSITHEARFQYLVDTVKNRDLQNGRFVWRVNTSQILETDKVHRSLAFRSGSASTARLFLYRDRAKKGHLKMSFVQMEKRSVKIWLSLLSHVRPEYMLCFEDLTGGIPTGMKLTKKKQKLIKHFSITVNFTELESKGFIQNDILYVRCLTTD